MRIPAQHVGDLGDLAVGLLADLPHLERQQRGEVAAPLDDAVGDVEQKRGALLGVRLRPVGERLARRSDRRVNVVERRRGVVPDHLRRPSGIQRRERLPAVDLRAADHQRIGAAELRSDASERLLETLVLFRSSEVEPWLVAERRTGGGDGHNSSYRRASRWWTASSSTSIPRPGPAGTATCASTTASGSVVICSRYLRGPIRYDG